ncbi:PKD domain-containing protein [Adhaeribacter sp. BT258]|uniref:PKD domain-containing protein n=1 Tax=Adhaeribacter terrigena TaxID=2793070 RepID=A0ABS1BZY3_9BACT|nr:PKD domain-containing protein [Adhaeribacter terrigena]MBK0401898.1 PKD domain-containing protein [Adhaeribacter terrigena]
MKIPFRKSSLYFQFLVLLLVLTGCSKDNVAPKAGIMADKYQAEPGEIITFTSTSSNLRDYAWELDNGVKSDEKVVKTSFDTPGNHVVKLKVTDRSGKTNETSINVYVGRFYLTTVGLTAMNFRNPDGNTWDADGSGPDLSFGLNTPGTTNYGWLVGDNITQKDIPKRLISGSPILLINNNYTFTIYETPEQGKTGTSRTIKSWQFNPVKEAQKTKYSNNNGIIVLPGQYPGIYFEYTVQ